jgi:hypothetical protein
VDGTRTCVPSSFIESPTAEVESSSEGVTAEFSMNVAADAPPQAYYVTVFAVADGAIGLSRAHFGLTP